MSSPGLQALLSAPTISRTVFFTELLAKPAPPAGLPDAADDDEPSEIPAPPVEVLPNNSPIAAPDFSI